MDRDLAVRGLTLMERVVHIGETGGVYGILSESDAGSPGHRLPAVIFLNAGFTPRTGPRRIHVQIARRLNERGIASLRLDLPGIGDSAARSDGLPARQGAREEIRAAMDYLTDDLGFERFVVFGICSGADYAFRVGREDHRVAGLILVNGYSYRTAGNLVRHYLSRLTRLRNWSNQLQGRQAIWLRLTGRAAEPTLPKELQLGFYDRPLREEADSDLRTMLDRGVRVCVVHSYEETYNHLEQFERALPSARNSEQVSVEYIDYADHTFTLLAAQDRLVRYVESWVHGVDWAAI